MSRWALRETPVFRLEALVHADNAASIKVLESAGFHREGVLRNYLEDADGRGDAILYSLVESDVAEGVQDAAPRQMQSGIHRHPE